MIHNLRTKDLLLYLAISFAVVGFVLAATESGGNWDSFLKVFILLGLTTIVFYYFIYGSRRLWSRRSFWILTSVFALVHCVGCVVVVTHMKVVNPWWFAATWIELLIFVGLKGLILPDTQRRNHEQ